MGQKINPHGLRVCVIRDWDSRWCSNREKGSKKSTKTKIRDEDDSRWFVTKKEGNVINLKDFGETTNFRYSGPFFIKLVC